MFKLETILLAAGLCVVGLFCEGAGYHRLWSHKAYQVRSLFFLNFSFFYFCIHYHSNYSFRHVFH